MKKKINLSKKEKNLLIILLLVVLFWLFYRFVFAKQSIKIAELNQEITNYNDELFKIDNILAKDKAIADEWSKLNSDVENIQSKYFSTINQPEIINLLNDIVDSNSLKVPGMYFSGPDYAMLGDIETKYLGISIPFEGSYDELGAFFSHLTSSSKVFWVDQLAISKGDGEKLNGQISLKTYSYDEIIDGKSDSTYKAEVQRVIKENPFQPYESYIKESQKNINDNIDTDVYVETEKRTILEDFEGEELYFLPTSPDVTGKVTKFNDSKFGKYSLRTEYFISTENREERAYVTLDDKDIILKYPPSNIGIWTHSYGYSPITLGLRLQDQEGNKIDLELAKGINWTGWEYIEAMPPQDINLYPLKLDRIYLQLGPSRDDYGVLLFDNIETLYPLDVEKEEIQDKGYSFYLVQYGDTLESISEKVYGTKSKYKIIMDKNEINSNSDLDVGQVLVIPN